ncbi:phosphate acetyl/butaryl transferase [Helicosporidium sp. ATCC 50920]|nr:phosphate acetyl/butaryl transferase [Helicosporidium sp. ATCC 50920]|eukprot:KDD74569.1 phosphate acetyl/butaryl transferase [Helicosporidium sp. ATCC 50920]
MRGQADGADRLNAPLSSASPPSSSAPSLHSKYTQLLLSRRAHKGLTLASALDQMQDPNVVGTLMVACGDADGMVSGATCTTAATIRPALQLLKAPGRLVSSLFFMCLPDRVLAYGDCAVNPDPSAEQLAQIAESAAETTRAFGVEPRVAMLSYSTLGSGSGPAVDKVAAAVEKLQAQRPDLMVEGPIQYDAAVDSTVAAAKVKKASEVAGRATVCVFPDLNTGNNTYKAVQQSTGALAVGPLMMGLQRPVNDLSRGCTVADIVNTIACTAVQAIGLKDANAAAEEKKSDVYEG